MINNQFHNLPNFKPHSLHLLITKSHSLPHKSLKQKNENARTRRRNPFQVLLINFNAIHFQLLCYSSNLEKMLSLFVFGNNLKHRYELLNMVKKHSNSLGQTELLMDQQQQDGAPDDVELDQLFWHDILDLYFVRGKESRGRQDDDLLFFIRKLVTKFIKF